MPMAVSRRELVAAKPVAEVSLMGMMGAEASLCVKKMFAHSFQR
jgi:hypothetical protein